MWVGKVVVLVNSGCFGLAKVEPKAARAGSRIEYRMLETIYTQSVKERR